jgi:lambda repressor-like predicted transcriptional regulator
MVSKNVLQARQPNDNSECFRRLPEGVRHYCALRGIFSQRAWAKRAGVPQSTLVSVLTRLEHKELKTLATLSAYLGWSPDTFANVCLSGREKALHGIRKRLREQGLVSRQLTGLHQWIYQRTAWRTLKVYQKVFVEALGVCFSDLIPLLLTTSELQDIDSLSTLMG